MYIRIERYIISGISDEVGINWSG